MSIGNVLSFPRAWFLSGHFMEQDEAITLLAHAIIAQACLLSDAKKTLMQCLAHNPDMSPAIVPLLRTYDQTTANYPGIGHALTVLKQRFQQ